MCRGRLAQSPAKASKSSTQTGHFAPFASGRLEESEVATLVGAEDFARVKLCVTALRRRCGQFRSRRACFKFRRVDGEIDAALLDREADAVAVLDQRQRTARGGVRRYVQHDGAER